MILQERNQKCLTGVLIHIHLTNLFVGSHNYRASATTASKDHLSPAVVQERLLATEAYDLIERRIERRIISWSKQHLLLWSANKDLMVSLADDSLDKKLRKYANPEILLIDEVGFDRLEQESARNASLFFKVTEGHSGTKLENA